MVRRLASSALTEEESKAAAEGAVDEQGQEEGG